MASSEPTPTKRLAGVSGGDDDGDDDEDGGGEGPGVDGLFRRSHNRCFNSV